MERIIIRKNGKILYEAIMHLILIGVIFGLFFFAAAGKIDSRGTKQQILEKQTALLIDSAKPGMTFTIKKNYEETTINDLVIKNGKVFATVDGLGSIKGYPFFTKYSVLIEKELDKFVIKVIE